MGKRRRAIGGTADLVPPRPGQVRRFRRRYTAELAQPGAKGALARLRVLAADRPVTLLTATKDLDLSQAAVLAGLLRETP